MLGRSIDLSLRSSWASRVENASLFLLGFSIPLSIASVNFFLVVVFLFWLKRLCADREDLDLDLGPIHWAFLFYLSAWLLSALFSPSFSVGLKTFPKQHHFILFFMLVSLHRSENVFWVIKGFLAGALTSAAIGIALFAFWNVIDPPHIPGWMYWFGPRINHQLVFNRYQIYCFKHPMTFGGLMVPAGLMFLGLFLGVGRGQKKALFLFFLTVVLCALVGNKQRGPWVGMGLGAIFLSALYRKKIMVLFVGSIIVLPFIFNHDVRQRVVSLWNPSGDATIHHRVAIWNGGFYIARRHFWTGTGPGQVKRALSSYEKNVDFPPNPRGLGWDMHNLFLSELVSKGILGLVSCFWLLGTFVFVSRRCVRDLERAPSHPFHLDVVKSVYIYFLIFPIMNLTESAFEDGEIKLVVWCLAACVSIFVKKNPLVGTAKNQ